MQIFCKYFEMPFKNQEFKIIIDRPITFKFDNKEGK